MNTLFWEMKTGLDELSGTLVGDLGSSSILCSGAWSVSAPMLFRNGTMGWRVGRGTDHNQDCCFPGMIGRWHPWVRTGNVTGVDGELVGESRDRAGDVTARSSLSTTRDFKSQNTMAWKSLRNLLPLSYRWRKMRSREVMCPGSFRSLAAELRLESGLLAFLSYRPLSSSYCLSFRTFGLWSLGTWRKDV